MVLLMSNTPQDAPGPEQTFARRLRELREAAGLTQKDIAEQLDVHQTAIAKIEAGTRPVSLGEAVQLSKMLGVSLDMLAGIELHEYTIEVAVRAHRLMRMFEQMEAARAEADRLWQVIAKEKAVLDGLEGNKR